jgi:hypothetical protein
MQFDVALTGMTSVLNSVAIVTEVYMAKTVF